MEYISTQEAAKKWGVSLRYVQRLLRDGRIPEARKYGVAWMIPARSDKPRDPRRNGDRDAVTFVAHTAVPMMYLRGGDVDAAYRRCASEEEVTLLKAQLACFACEDDRTRELALPLLHTAQEPLTRLGSGLVLALAAMRRGDVRAWRETLDAIRTLELCGRPEIEREMVLTALNIGMHGKDSYPEWLNRGDFSGVPDELFPYARYLYVKSLYVKWKEIELLAIAEPMISECRREHSCLAEVYLRVTAAVAYNDLGKPEPASEHLKKAAAIAWPLRLLSPFVENQHTLCRLTDDCLGEWYPEMLAAIYEQSKTFWDNWSTLYSEIWQKPMVSGLTARELEATRLFSRGLTVAEVSRRMGISKSSVKKYLNVAYNKMNVEKKDDIRRLVHS